MLRLLAIGGLTCLLTSPVLAIEPTVDAPGDPTASALPIFRAAPRRVQGRLRTLAPGELDDTATAAVWPGQQLRDRHLQLGEALDQQAGLRVQSIGGFGAPTTLQVRGSNADQVAVFVDDVPLLALDGAPIDLSDVPLGQVERVELYRSMTPAQLGTGAMGGTLRLLLRQPRQPGGEVHVGAGSYGARQVEAAAAWAGDRARVSVGLRWLEAVNDYPYTNTRGTSTTSTDDGVLPRRNAGMARLGGTASGHVSWRSWDFDGRWLGSGLSQGVPGPALFEASEAHLQQQRHLGVLAATGHDLWGQHDQMRLALHGGWTNQTVDDRLGELGVPWWAQQTTSVAGAQWTYTSAPLGPAVVQTRLGAHVGQVDVQDLRTQQAGPPSRRHTLAAGLGIPITLGVVELVPSLSADWQQSHRMTMSGVPTTWHEVDGHDERVTTARLGLGWRPRPGVHTTLAVSQGARAPTLQELFGNDLAIRGNATLRPEQALTLDGGLTLAGPVGPWQGALQLTGFDTQAIDLIQLQVYGQREALYQNVASARLRGAELSAVLQLPHVRATLQHAQLWTADTGTDPAYVGKSLPLRPAARSTLRLDGDLEIGSWQTSAWLALQAQSSYPLDAAGQVTVPARAVASAGLRLGRGAWFADVRVDDLTDAVRVDLIGWPLPGRTVFAALGWRGWQAGN